MPILESRIIARELFKWEACWLSSELCEYILIPRWRKHVFTSFEKANHFSFHLEFSWGNGEGEHSVFTVGRELSFHGNICKMQINFWTAVHNVHISQGSPPPASCIQSAQMFGLLCRKPKERFFGQITAFCRIPSF